MDSNEIKVGDLVIVIAADGVLGYEDAPLGTVAVVDSVESVQDSIEGAKAGYDLHWENVGDQRRHQVFAWDIEIAKVWEPEEPSKTAGIKVGDTVKAARRDRETVYSVLVSEVDDKGISGPFTVNGKTLTAVGFFGSEGYEFNVLLTGN